MVEAHIDRRADITIAAQPVTAANATEMGIFRFDRSGPDRRLRRKTDARFASPTSVKASRPGRRSACTRRTGPSSPRWGSTSSRATCCSRPSTRKTPPTSDVSSFRPRWGAYRVNAHLFRGYWADVGTVRSFYDANIMPHAGGRPVQGSTTRALRSTRTRASCRSATRRLRGAGRDHRRGLPARALHDRGVDRRHPNQRTGPAPSSVDRCCSAPTSSKPTTRRRPRVTARDRHRPGRRARGRDRGQDARIGDGARLVNDVGVQRADGDGYLLRDGVIIVPKDGVIKPGTSGLGTRGSPDSSPQPQAPSPCSLLTSL